MLSKVKTALRISHNLLDGDISDNIAAAKAELVRAGVNSGIVNEADDPLVVRAIKTYCLSMFSDDVTKAEKYMESFKYQLDNMRKSSSYVG